jgi:hypothetical protein
MKAPLNQIRLLLATAVNVQTSVVTAIGQPTNIKDQSVLNSNLMKNGLPSGTFGMQSAVNVTMPVNGPVSFET